MPDDAPATDARYDAAAIERLARFGGNALVDRMIAMFLADVPPRVERMQRAAEAGDASTVAAAMHSLKSTAAQLGLVALASRCARAEQLCRAGDLAAALADVRDVAAALPDDMRWLRRHAGGSAA
jgi:HPt (histidine-containing phosphotransfer) domain-containing protein